MKVSAPPLNRDVNDGFQHDLERPLFGDLDVSNGSKSGRWPLRLNFDYAVV